MIETSPQSIHSVVTEVLVSITGAGEIASAPDLEIRKLGLLDSLGVVNLIVALCERLGVDISPAELEETDVATPRAIEGFVQRKLGK